MRVLQHYIRVDNHIVVLTLAHTLVDGMPRAQVGPSEVTLHYVHVLAMFQDGIVDGQVGIAWVVLGDVLQFLLIGVVGILKFQVTQYAGEYLLKALGQVSSVRDKHTRVPIEFATLHEHLCKLTLRLLCERLHAEHLRLATQVAQLDIAIAWLRTRGLHPHHQQHIVFRHIAYPYLQTTGKRFLVHHHVVRRCYDNVGIRVYPFDTHVSPSYAGCRITVQRLYQNLVLIEVGQLLLDNGHILLTRTYIYVLFRE